MIADFDPLKTTDCNISDTVSIDFSQFDEELTKMSRERALTEERDLLLITPELEAIDDEKYAYPEIFIDPIKRSKLTDEEIINAFGGFDNE